MEGGSTISSSSGMWVKGCTWHSGQGFSEPEQPYFYSFPIGQLDAEDATMAPHNRKNPKKRDG